jgi:hypothetical protein
MQLFIDEQPTEIFHFTLSLSLYQITHLDGDMKAASQDAHRFACHYKNKATDEIDSLMARRGQR